MSRRQGWGVGVLVLGLLPQLGCLSTHSARLEPAPGVPVGEASKGGHGELPPEQAARACLVTAQTLEKNGAEAEAITLYEKARGYDPSLVGVSRRLAVLYDRQGDKARAAAEYAQALKSNPRDVELLNDLGYFHYEHGNWSEAEKWLRQATTLDPGYRRAWVNLGLVLGQAGRYQDSYQAFARAVSPAEAQANVGMILAQQGKDQEARAALHQALALTPDLPAARAVLARLESPAAPTTAFATGSPLPDLARTHLK